MIKSPSSFSVDTTLTSPAHPTRPPLLASLAALSLSFLPLSATAQTAGVLREVWRGIPGTQVSDLTNHARFPSQPDAESILGQFEAPTDVDDDYGQRLQALIRAPASGNYTFWIASDDGSVLHLSTDDSPINKRVIASVPEWTSSRQWTKYPEQRSAPISLVAGRQYYLEALMKEGGGGDNLAVRWQLPGGAMEEPIPGTRLTVYGLGPPEITRQPASVSTHERGSATFSITLARQVGATFQWQRNNLNLPDANSSTLHFPTVTLSDHGSTFRCLVTNPYGSATSSVATLSVLADTTPPTLVSAVNLGTPTRLTVLFSEPVEPATATNPANYTIDQGIAVTAATFADDTRTLVLTTTAMVPGPVYRLTVSNVRDLATAPNTIQANSQRTFSLDYTPLSVALVRGTAEPPGPSSRTSGLAITEIHYHPQPHPDGRNLEFIELFNSEATAIVLSGYRISGSVDYTFPPGITIPARGYRVVAAVPADLQAVHGIANVLGPFDGNLPNSSGLIRLRNPLNAVLLEIEYTDRDPWPVAADGAGPSLVLARPSYGEGDPRGWAASDLAGGTPGRAETLATHPYATVLINELLAHTDAPLLDFIELFNYGTQSIDLGGCTLSDRPNDPKFTIPAGTSIPAKGHVAFTETQLGFALSTLGETLYLKDPEGARVIDVVRFEAQANGVSIGRYPDGAPTFHELTLPTPGAPNANLLIRDVVINEIMYNPISGDDADEYVELFNRGASPVDLGGWRFTDGIDFTFPPGTVLPAQGYLVAGKSVARLLANYPALNPGNTVGNYRGALANGGERLVLSRFATTVTTNNNVAITNVIHIPVDEVHYRDGGRWGRLANRRGSSLELRDARSDNRLAPNWADSDETGKAPWTTIEHTGIIDHGNGSSDELHLILLGDGECLIDNLEVFVAGGPNRVANGTFESGLEHWVIQGNHVESALRTTEGFDSSRSLHLRASAGGDNGANRVKTKLSGGFSPGQTVTLRAQARWLSGHTNLLLRLKGNYLEAVGSLPLPPDLGTPGEPNTRATANAGPAIHSVTHTPVLPSAGQSVRVIAQVHDPDGLASLQLRYRLDPATNLTLVSMVYQGAGFYSATIPAQSSGSLVAFHIRATDAHPNPQTSLFPDDAPIRECLVRFGETIPSGTFGSYRLWMTQTNINTWTQRERLSNQALDGTFVYDNSRVVYNAGARYRGSPFIRPGYNSPVGNLTAYVWSAPEDDLILGEEEFNLDTLEPDRDGTRQREITSFWIASELGVPTSYQRYIHVYVNGIKRGDVYTDSQQPNASFVRSWFADDNNGQIFKIDDWFEFNDSVAREFNIDATLQNFTTTGGVKKQARYRWNWEKKSNRGLDDDYTALFQLVDAFNTPGTHAYTDAVEAIVDIEQWLRVFAARRIVADWDGYGYNRGKNQFAYLPENSGWSMLLWDLDFSLGGGSHGPTEGLFSSNDPTMTRVYNHPPFRRAYLRAFYDAVHGPLLATRSGPVMDATYAALQANGINVQSPADIKTWISQRRNYLLQQLATVDAPLEFTVNSGNDFSTADNLVTLSGRAPVNVRTLKLNGVAYPVRWTSVTGWTLAYALAPGANPLVLEGFDTAGNRIAGLTDTLTVTYTGTPDSPQGQLIINEIMYHPAVPGAEFVELHNRSSHTAFNLSNYRLSGVGFAFPEGTVIPARGYVLAVENLTTFTTTYGSGLPVAGVYDGRLDNGGETLRLVQPGSDPSQDLTIAEVTYDDDPPWPAAADGSGPSLQLIDPSQNPNRVANWAAVASGGQAGGPTALIGMTDTWKYNQTGTDLGTAWRQPGYNDNAWPAGAALLYVENSPLPEAKNTPLTLGQTTYYFRQTFNFSGNPAATTLAARLIIDDGAVVYLNGVEVLRLGMPDGTITHSTFANRTVDNAVLEGPFTLANTSLNTGANVIAVEVHQVNAGSSDIVFGLSLESASNAGAPYTPGRPNSVAASLPTLPPLWLNEVQTDNATGIQDRFEERDPWVELHHSGATPITLDGFYLTTNYANPTLWPFPAGFTLDPGQFRLVWLDGEPAQTGADEVHAAFRLDPSSGSLALVQVTAGQTSIVDYLNYPPMPADRSYGAYPDGTPAKRTQFYLPTPGTSNSLGHPEVPIVVNEWMAANNTTLQDPLDGKFDDWIELYNAGSDAIDLAGFTLTDTLDNPTKWTFPEGARIAPHSFLLIWADGEPEQNELGPDLHAGFSLSAAGEAIGLFTPNGVLVDSVVFTEQTADISEGRWPDGAPSRFSMNTPTPGAPNLIDTPPNQPPVLTPIGDRTVPELTLHTFIVRADDPDPDQTLAFSLDPGAPPGAVIQADTGTFTWTPTEAQGPGTYSLTFRVTDDGVPSLSDARTITIDVLEVNHPPVLNPIGPKSVVQGTLLTFVTTASDPDLPPNTLTFSLDEGAPASAEIHPMTGVFSWTPSLAQEPGIYSVTVVVSDQGIPSLNAAETLAITVISSDPEELKFTGIEPSGDAELILTWSAEPGVNYQLESSDHLTAATHWTSQGDYTATGSTLSVTLPRPVDSNTFFRIRRLSP